MPDDSCRTCGGELVKHSRCSDCRRVIQKICTMCSLKTHKEFHSKCLNLELYQINNEMIRTPTQTVIYKTPKITNITKRGVSNKTLMLSGLIMIAITGLIFGNYLVPALSHIIPVRISNDEISPTNDNDQTSSTKTKVRSVNMMSDQDLVMKSDSFKTQYVNCLGVSDGHSLTINCPTDYGIVYKAIVDIPADLISQFESKVFHMRNFSVLENSNDLLIKYQKQTYVTTFMTK